MNYERVIREPTRVYLDINFYRWGSNWRLGKHRHPFYQIILVTDGVLHIEVHAKVHKLIRGHLCVIPPNEVHSLYTNIGYEQFGMNLMEKDSYGINDLLRSHIKNFKIFNRIDKLDQIALLKQEAEQLTRLAKLKLGNFADSMIFSCIEDSLQIDEIHFKRQLLQLLNENLSNKLTLTDLCKQLSISHSHLERLVSKEFGCGVIELYNQLRMDKACYMLTHSDLSIEDISNDLNFYDQAHFSRFFKQKKQMTPSQYRKSFRFL